MLTVEARKRSSVYAWVLNLDADVELETRGAYTPSRALERAAKRYASSLARTLLGPDDVIVGEGDARGLPGRAFCPTRRARALLEAAGAVPEPHPAHDVLRRVNGRAFSASLGQTIGGIFMETLDAALEVLARPPPNASRWRVKRAFGMAGRGQRVVSPGDLDDADRSFLLAAVCNGVQIEPDLTITRELALHGLLGVDGSLRVGRVVGQLCDARGQWLATRHVELDAPITEALEREVRRVAVALRGAMYFGPFGIDAFEYRTADGSLALQPRSEINARYSMGFGVGFGAAPCRVP